MSTPSQNQPAPENAPPLPALFGFHDFIRPGEQSLYAELDESVRHDLAPVGFLEHNLVDEIRRAMWRLRRCGLVEESLAAECSKDPSDPMQQEKHAKIQLTVDRARSQAHRLLHKCTAELRRLQTDRALREQLAPSPEKDLISYKQIVSTLTHAKRGKLLPFPPQNKELGSDCNPTESIARNARCPCGSGEKYKRCCGKDAPPVLGRAA
jgi:hypothetical protein